MTEIHRVYGVGAIVLGLAAFVFGDFALQWQPVPADWPARTALAYLNAALLLGAGLAMQLERSARAAALTLACYYFLWAVFLHMPVVLKTPEVIGVWNAPAEAMGMAVGGFIFYANTSKEPARANALRVARLLFGLSAVVFGVVHFVYAEYAATFVPSFIPPQLFWIYATGAGHVGAGVAMLLGIQLRLALPLFVLMLSSFVLFVHVTRLIATPAVHAEWLMLGVALTITGSALIAWRVLVTRRPVALPGHAAATVDG